MYTTEEGDTSTPLCLHTFHGRTCLVKGSIWNMYISHGEPHAFLADRPPASDAIPALAEALQTDMGFKLSPNVLRGAADTYFPAKVLAKMGRIIEINGELQRLKGGEPDNYLDADDAEVEEAAAAAARCHPVFRRRGREAAGRSANCNRDLAQAWRQGQGRSGGLEFLYDSSWGGFVNCGCSYTFKKGHEGEGSCNNTFPECPALVDVNEDFGNGWYNDHHFQ